MQNNPYQAPNKPITTDKAGVRESGPIQTMVSVFEMLIGGVGIAMYIKAAFHDMIALLVGLPFLAIPLLPLWSGVMLWRNNRYAWLPVSIVAVPLNSLMVYACVSEYFRLTHIIKSDPLKEAIENPHTIDFSILAGMAVFALLLLACAIYSFAIRNSMPQTVKSVANPDTAT